jgi:hypothetical protein
MTEPPPVSSRDFYTTRTDLNIGLPHHTMYVSPAETVDTVNISTNNFDAEQGMAGRGYHGHHQVRHEPRKEGSRR